MKRSVGVTVIAILALIGSVLALLMGILMLALMIFAPLSAKVPASPTAIKALFLGASLIYIAPAIWGILSGVGLLRLRNWARISIIIFSTLMAAMGLFGGLLALVMPLPANSGADASVTTGVRIFMAAFWLSLLGLAIWWLVFFTRSKVKSQFVPAQAAGVGNLLAPSSGLQGGIQVVPGQKRPVSITVIAWLLLIGCVFFPINILLHTPAVLFTKLLTGWAASICYVLYAVVQLLIGRGLLRLRPMARQGAIALYVFGLASAAVFYFAPGGQARMVSLIEKQRSMFPWLTSQTQPSLDLSRFFTFFAVLGLAAIVVPLYFVVTRKAAFEQTAETRG